MELNICHLYPDLLNLYGDRGNVLTLIYRCEERDIKVSIKEAPLGERVPFSDCDLFFIGSGQDADQLILQDELSQWRGAEIKSAIEDGKVFLAICGGYQILGHSYKTWDGKEMDFIGALDFYSVGEKERMIGDYMFRWDEPGEPVKIVGFENHSAKTYLGSGVRPFGKVLTGFGNNGTDHTEGVRCQNVFGSYSHGPLLPKNPILADWLIRLALERKYGHAELALLDDTLENKANQYMVARLTGK